MSKQEARKLIEKLASLKTEEASDQKIDKMAKWIWKEINNQKHFFDFLQDSFEGLMPDPPDTDDEKAQDKHYDVEFDKVADRVAKAMGRLLVAGKLKF